MINWSNNFFKSTHLDNESGLLLKTRGKKDPLGTKRLGKIKIAEGTWVSDNSDEATEFIRKRIQGKISSLKQMSRKKILEENEKKAKYKLNLEGQTHYIMDTKRGSSGYDIIYKVGMEKREYHIHIDYDDKDTKKIWKVK